MLGEGRGLSSRQTQDVVRNLEIGQPSNSEKCSETADGVTRESEGGSRLSLLPSVRQSMDPSRRKMISAGVGGIGCTNLSGLLTERLALLALMGIRCFWPHKIIGRAGL